MRHVLLIAALVALACVPAGPVRATSLASTSTLLAVQLEPAVSGVRICWQTRCFETDAAGRWAHSVDVTAGTNYELVATAGVVEFIGVQGTSDMSVTWLSDTRVRFKFAAPPAATSGPITIYVEQQAPVTATPTAMATGTPEPGPTPTGEPWETPTVWGGYSLTLEERCVVENALLEAVQQQYCIRPPLSLEELSRSTLYIAAHAYSPGTPGSNWVVSPGVPLTGEITVETDMGTVMAMAFADVFVMRAGLRLWVCQWGACVWGGIRPGMWLEVVDGMEGALE
jgi:hypothetical protein